MASDHPFDYVLDLKQVSDFMTGPARWLLTVLTSTLVVLT